MPIESLHSITEDDLHTYFILHYKRYGFSKVKRIKRYGDFDAWKGGKRYRVEIEKKASNFILHGHDPKIIDLIFVLIEDRNINQNNKIVKFDGKHVLEWINSEQADEILKEHKAVQSISIDTEIKSIKGELVIKIPEEFYIAFPEKTLVSLTISKLGYKQEKLF